MPTTAYSYIRFSTPDQMKGDSLRRQLESSRSIAASNGWHLDESLRDLGVSAFKGANRTAGALGKFLKLVESGTVKSGSVLIVESLDRLSRDEVLKAFKLFTGILESGITVHTTADGKTYTEKSVNGNPMDLMMSILIMSRANEESKMKSLRSLSNWENKRRNATHSPVTSRVPGWIQVVNGKLELIPERVKMIHRIAKMSISGMGYVAICRKLNAEKVPVWGRGKLGWDISTLQGVLHSRRLIGEYQPNLCLNKRTRKPAGKPIKGYYPAAMTEAEFYKLQAALDSRKTVRGRGGNTASNLFGSILFESNGSKLVLSQSSRGIPTLRSLDGIRGVSSYMTFSYGAVEKHFLNWIKDIRINSDTSDDSELASLVVESAKLGEKISEMEKAIRESDASAIASLAKLNTQFSIEKSEVDRKIENCRKESAKEEVSTQDIAALLKEENTPETRVKIRTAIQALIKRIELKTFNNPDLPMERYILATVEFHTGEVRRLLIGTGRKLNWSLVTMRIHPEHPSPFRNLKELAGWIAANGIGYADAEGKLYKLVKAKADTIPGNPLNRLMEAAAMPFRVDLEASQHPGWIARALPALNHRMTDAAAA